VDLDPSEQTCNNFIPRNYHEMYTNSIRMVSDLLRFVGRILFLLAGSTPFFVIHDFFLDCLDRGW
jgi:hypothetical protein